MSESRSVELYSTWLEGTTKLDYYIVGIALAVVGYWGKSVGPLEVGSVRQFVEFFGLLLILASAYLGLRRIETTLMAVHANHDRLHYGERAGALLDALQKSPLLLNREDATVMRREQALAQVAEAKKMLPIADAAFDSLAQTGHQQYQWRNFLLMAGLVLGLASKIWPHCAR